MDIRELRINNYVSFERRMVKVQCVNVGLNNTEEVIVLDTDNCRAGCTMEHIDGIPLNEDILVKCGFDILHRYKNGKVDASFGKLYLYAGDDSYVVEYGETYHFVELCKVEHLHQLQNIVFALLGKELKIEL